MKIVQFVHFIQHSSLPSPTSSETLRQPLKISATSFSKLIVNVMMPSDVLTGPSWSPSWLTREANMIVIEVVVSVHDVINMFARMSTMQMVEGRQGGLTLTSLITTLILLEHVFSLTILTSSHALSPGLNVQPPLIIQLLLLGVSIQIMKSRSRLPEVQVGAYHLSSLHAALLLQCGHKSL
jgi:hypothetical protein